MTALWDGPEKQLKVEVNRDKSGSGPSEGSSLLGFGLYGRWRGTTCCNTR